MCVTGGVGCLGTPPGRVSLKGSLGWGNEGEGMEL